MNNTGFGLPIAFAFVICFGGTALAQMPYSKTVQKACAADYRAHCSEYGLETAALRTCMTKLANNCQCARRGRSGLARGGRAAQTHGPLTRRTDSALR
jgi:hypothetical protein